MGRSRGIRLGVLLAVLTAGLTMAQRVVAVERQPDPLLAGFRTPPHAARPQVWWHWMSGNVTAVGARLDLEWMQRVGIGGVHAFAGGLLERPMVPHPLPFMSDGWSAIYRDAVRQARAAGMEVAIAGSPRLERNRRTVGQARTGHEEICLVDA